ncbi:MAG TPA: DNA-directed RNA polymerase subunit alpha C-terminal domain-containing protein [Candidatus Aquilonibacter sp.]|nr:DNA-directed RNA polymerase subunit alpha C-terminal domain-containing protein [Candidatus Aquilonibacter sp.]
MPNPHRHFPARNSPADFLFIPREIRRWEISRFSLSVRLEHALGYMGCRQMGDLHGRRLSDIIRWRNIGKKLLGELIQLVRRVQEGKQTAHPVGPQHRQPGGLL